MNAPSQGSAPSTSTLLRDHPGWLTSPDGRVRRAFWSGDAVWAVVCEPVSATFEPTVEVLRADDDVHRRLVVDRADPARLLVPDYMAQPLRARGPVHRVRNPDLWDALVVAVLRQNNRAPTGDRQYRTLCEAYGETVSTTAGPALLVPRPEVVVGLTDGMFTSLRMRHKRRPLWP